MKITRVSCEQFAGARDRMVSFTDGINVIYGKNESGKSTLVNLLFATLFQRARLDNRSASDRDFRELYFPAAKRGRSVVGDSIDGKVTIETDKGAYILSKRWGAVTDCCLSTPDGNFRDLGNVEELLKELLVYGRGVYEDLLFTSQSTTERALMDLLNPAEKKETKQEIVGAVSQAFAESDGIPMDVIEQAILDRISAIEGKHWDADRDAPAYKAGRWAIGLGEILQAYYAWENAKDALECISDAETELLRAVTEYNEKDAAARAAEEAYQRFNTYAGRLAAQGERKKSLERLARDVAKVAEVLSKWPQLAAAVERAKALKEEKAHREALDLQAAVQAERARITPEDLRLAEAACPDAAELAQVQSAQRELAKLENQLCGVNLTAAVQMLGGHQVEITSLRTGEVISLTDGNAAITEAVLITVPGVMEMRLSAANVDVEAVETQMTACKETIAAILGKYGVASVEALERHAKAVEAAKFAIDHGVDAVIGHGPHLLRPIEIYKGKPIFYSLGDFILNNENIPYSPEDYYEPKGMTSDDTMHELFIKRSNNFTRGLQTDRKMFETVIPLWEMDEDRKVTKLRLMPVELGFGLPRSRNGMPAPAKDDAILHRLAEMSAPYGTKMEIKDGIATVIID